MQIRQLNLKEIEKIYRTDIIYQFPPEEMKPFSSMEALYERGMYLCFGLYEGEDLLAYAFFVREETVRQILLDYYVVCSPYRNRGLGGRFLQMLRCECVDYDAMLIEVENPAYAESAADRALQQRRVDFYTRNGFRKTTIEVNLFETEYSIMAMDIAACPDDDLIFEELDRSYRKMLGEWYAEKVFFRRTEELNDA